MTKQRFYTAGRSGAWFEISPEQAERIRNIEWWQMEYAKSNPKAKATVIFPAESEQQQRDIWRWRRYKARLEKGAIRKKRLI